MSEQNAVETNTDPINASISVTGEYFPEVAQYTQAAWEHDSIVAKWLNESGYSMDEQGRLQRRVDLAHDGLTAVKQSVGNPWFRPLLAAGLTLTLAACTVEGATPTNTPVIPSVQPSRSPDETQTPAPTYEVTLPPATASAPSETAKPVDPILEQNLQNWLNKEISINPLTGTFLLENGKTLYFGLDTHVDHSDQGDYLYLGYILGAMENKDGHVIAFIGMEDGTEDHNRYFVPVRLGDTMIINESGSRTDELWNLGPPTTTSSVFYDKVKDGEYSGRLIKLRQPYNTVKFGQGQYPSYFPGIVDDINANAAASNSLHAFALDASTQDCRTLSGPDFINAGPKELANIDIKSLPFAFLPQVNIAIDPTS